MGLPLFSNTISLEDHITHLQRLADRKAHSFDISVGFFKNMRGEIKYSGTLILYDRHNKNHSPKMITGNSVTDLITQFETYVESIKE